LVSYDSVRLRVEGGKKRREKERERRARRRRPRET